MKLFQEWEKRGMKENSGGGEFKYYTSQSNIHFQLIFLVSNKLVTSHRSTKSPWRREAHYTITNIRKHFTKVHYYKTISFLSKVSTNEKFFLYYRKQGTNKYLCLDSVWSRRYINT
jgi:hypothetical protein